MKLLTKLKNKAYETIGVYTPMQRKALEDPRDFHQAIKEISPEVQDSLDYHLSNYFEALKDLKIGIVMDRLIDSYYIGEFPPNTIPTNIRKYTQHIEDVVKARNAVLRYGKGLEFENSPELVDIGKSIQIHMTAVADKYDPLLQNAA